MIDHSFTDNIVCPYCGHIDIDSWDIDPGAEDLGLLECDECGESFYAERHISIDYTTRKATKGTCSICGEIDIVVEDVHTIYCKIDCACQECIKKARQEGIDNFLATLNSQALNT